MQMAVLIQTEEHLLRQTRVGQKSEVQLRCVQHKQHVTANGFSKLGHDGGGGGVFQLL